MVETVLNYSLIGYAVMSCTSIAGASIFIGLATFAALIKVIRDKKLPSFGEPKLLKALGIFLAAMLLSAAFSPDLGNSLGKVFVYTIRMTLLFLVALFIRDARVLFLFVLGMTFSISVADCVAIWQGLHGDFRAVGIGKSPMVLAGYLVQIIGLLLVMVNVPERWGKYKVIFSISLLLSFVALLFNSTRGAWLAVIPVLMIYSFYRIKNKKQWLLGCLLVLFFLTLIFMTFPPFHERVLSIGSTSYQSNSERILLWKSSWQMFMDHPLLGIGVGNFLHEYTTHYISPLAVERGLGHAHNNFFQMLADAGAIGFLSFIYLYYVILQTSYRNYKQTRSIYSLALILATAGLLLQGMTEFNFGDSAVIRLYWFLTGIGFSSVAYQGVYHRSDESGAKHS